MTTTWFTADLHLGHSLVSGLRGFSDTDDHDAHLLESLRRSTRKGDSLWVLGDISSGSSRSEHRALNLMREWRDSTGVELHLIPGNHDSIHPMHRSSLKRDDLYRDVFRSVQPFARRRVSGSNVWLSHFPWYGDHTDGDRYSVARLREDPAGYLLHGHTHSDHVEGHHDRQIHVGLDAWDLSPAPIERIETLIANHKAQQ